MEKAINKAYKEICKSLYENDVDHAVAVMKRAREIYRDG